MDTIETEDFYNDISNDLEGKCNTSDYLDERINLYKFKRVNKKVLGISNA